GLGCVLYEALTAEVPFPKAGPAAKMYAHLSTAPPSLRAQRPDLPEQLDTVVTRAMAKDPADRQQIPEQFAVEAASAVGLSVPPWAGPEARAAAPARRRAVDPTLAPAPEQARDGHGPSPDADGHGPSPVLPVSPEADGHEPSPVSPDGDGHGPLLVSPHADGHRQPVTGPGADGGRPRSPAPAVADGDGHPAAVAGPTPAEAAPRLGDSDYYEPVFYRQPRRRPRRRLLLWVLLVLLFIAAPLALALALAGNSSAATLAGGRAPAPIVRRVQPARATPIFSGRSSIRTGSAPSKDS
ncbi:MAG TPA: hypothetical protein VFN87_13855, partial [Solirubrobacteraceae bacterium]|nr:hypothetical protein [Solirubrobacteraceae bacterium]